MTSGDISLAMRMKKRIRGYVALSAVIAAYVGAMLVLAGGVLLMAVGVHETIQLRPARALAAVVVGWLLAVGALDLILGP